MQFGIPWKDTRVRKCGDCTACCNGALTVDEPGLQLSYGHPCPHLTCGGCGVYKTHQPAVCSDYRCGWLEEPNAFPFWMRPDKSGAIVSINRDDWCGFPVDIVNPVREQVPPITLRWLKKLSVKKNRMQIYRDVRVVDGEVKYGLMPYGPEAFIRYVDNAISNGLRFE